MAYVKILKIMTVKHCNQAINYVENPGKTEQQEYISGYACEPENASLDFLMTKEIASRYQRHQRSDQHPVEAYHIIQSFAPGEVTPEQAHAIGKQLAQEFLHSKHEFVIATHTDKAHVHNHIILNPVSFYDHKKFSTQPYKTIAELRDISDRLCMENDLSVIENPAKMGYSYREWQERNRNSSWKSELRKVLDFILERATSYEEFKDFCTQLNLYYDDTGKYNCFRMVGQQRNVRGKTLDKNGKYTVEGIKSRCQENAERGISKTTSIVEAWENRDKKPAAENRMTSQLEWKLRQAKQAATRKRVHQMNDVLWTMKNEGIETWSDFDTITQDLQTQVKDIDRQMEEVASRKEQYQLVAKWLYTVDTYKHIQEEIDHAKLPWTKKKLRSEHQFVLEKLEEARVKLSSYGISEDLSVDKVIAMVDQSTEEIGKLTQDKAVLEKRMEKLETARIEMQRPEQEQPEVKRHRSNDMEL